MVVYACVGGRTCTCIAERWGLGPGLMRCFRDNARRGVDMWFGRRLYAIFYSLFLITYFSIFFTLPFLSLPLQPPPPPHPHSFCCLLISSVWRLTVTNRGTPQQYLHTTGGTNYYRLFSSSFQKPWLFMWDCRIYEGFHFKMLCVSLRISCANSHALLSISSWLHPCNIDVVSIVLKLANNLTNGEFFLHNTEYSVQLVAT